MTLDLQSRLGRFGASSRRAAAMARAYATGHVAAMSLPTAMHVGWTGIAEAIDATERDYSDKLKVIAETSHLRCYSLRGKRAIWAPRETAHKEVAFLFAEDSYKPYFQGRHVIQRGDTVLDVGGNIGLFTASALQAGAKHIIVIEPAPENLAALQCTFSDEISQGRVRLVPAGAWSEETTLTLYRVPGASGHNSFLNHRSNTVPVTVSVTTIDAVLHGARVDFIKLDVEGAEVAVLKGAENTLASFRPRLSVATEHSATNAIEVRAALPSYRTRLKSTVRVQGRWVPEVLFCTPRK